MDLDYHRQWRSENRDLVRASNRRYYECQKRKKDYAEQVRSDLSAALRRLDACESSFCECRIQIEALSKDIASLRSVLGGV